jgi:hypothetical protein
MKDFLGTLQRMYGVKHEYKTHQIVEAYNAFCLNQVIEVKKTTALKTQGYYTVNEPLHPWNGRTVKSSMKENDYGMVLVYFGTQTKHFHKSKLI